LKFDPPPLAGVAYCNSSHYYGWKPDTEYVFRYESQVDSGIPEIRFSQKAGLRLTSTIRVQTKQDYSLRIKFENSRFTTFNGVQGRQQEQEEAIPEPLK
jgi:hypothetical protein